MNKELYLIDLIDVNTLQKIQDGFSDMTGMAALTADENGVAVTKGSNFTDFCMKYTRNSVLGNKRCELCDKMGAELTHRSGKPCNYYCHAGLVDFAAPIIANGKMIGSFIGGQVLTEMPDPEKTRQIAAELGIDPEQYIDAIMKVKIVERKYIEKTSNFLCTTASILSDMAYKSYKLYLSNIEIEKAAKMKSDFLANMSHEIRTPMNAVLGMTDLALREEMSPSARDYLHQIKASGKNLLVIINDILDFSKIESGKMDIIEVEYEPLSVINDLSSIVNNRIGGKNVEFIIDISPSLPQKLWGDNVRIHQIMLNLLTNAVKFTKEGMVCLKIDCEKTDDDTTAVIKVTVSDTGMGIKQEDLNKIFHSFQQVDSKRNRNIEGTGLGLAISQQLLRLMNGKISVESEYGKGTIFSFELPQKIINGAPSASKPDRDITAAVFINNKYVKQQVIKDVGRLCSICTDLSETSENINEVNADYFIVEQSLFEGSIKDFFVQNPEKQCLIIDKYNDIHDYKLPNVRILRKPVYSLGLYNAMGVQVSVSKSESDNSSFSYISPDARILIVDDNHVNLTVAKGLLEPLKMNIDTASSAAEAIEMIKKNIYDLIFMDHMMPEVDGVEATHIIRRLIPGYSETPIIALTANAVGNAKEMFISEGMNDFVAKPIEIRDIISKLRKWLPQDKIVPVSSSENIGQNTDREKSRIKIDGLNVESAISLLGSEKLFMTALKEYYCSIDRKADVILEHKNAKRWRDYTIEVHSLKSTSKQIGADHVSELAAEMEKAGNSENIELINQKTDEMLLEYRKYKEILKSVFPEENTANEDKTADPETILKMIEEMQDALDNFDTLLIDEVIEKMSAYEYTDNEYFEKLKVSAGEYDIDRCSKILSHWKNKYNK
ncbi:MAG: PocR ligand-binding domain-containing protein [Porcipelethomonas sp.]